MHKYSQLKLPNAQIIATYDILYHKGDAKPVGQLGEPELLVKQLS